MELGVSQDRQRFEEMGSDDKHKLGLVQHKEDLGLITHSEVSIGADSMRVAENDEEMDDDDDGKQTDRSKARGSVVKHRPVTRSMTHEKYGTHQ